MFPKLAVIAAFAAVVVAQSAGHNLCVCSDIGAFRECCERFGDFTDSQSCEVNYSDTDIFRACCEEGVGEATCIGDRLDKA